MSDIQEPYIVNYCGVSTKITPIGLDGDMQYLVHLPTRNLLIETVEDEDEIHFWVEAGGHRTQVAEELGALIESRDM